MSEDQPVRRGELPLIAHVVYRFDYGGLENGIVNLINATQGELFRHCVIALTKATEFRKRLRAPEVAVHELGKKPGKDFAAYVRLYRLLRRLGPSVLHTRNIGTLDCAVVGRLAGVPVCVHGEHGWDIHDPDGTKSKFRYFRRIASPFIRLFVTVSRDLREWLIESVGISSRKVIHICNGVDTERFRPGHDVRRHPELENRFTGDSIIVGSVLRFEEIKDPMNLINAFNKAYRACAATGIKLRLVMIGDGPLREQAIAALEDAGIIESTWLPGSREDVAEIMRSFDLFVLGSRREGISNTLLEAMASGLPAIATNTGGNIELVRPDVTGELVPPESPEALAVAIQRYAEGTSLRKASGAAARRAADSEYSLDRMIEKYRRLYADAIADVQRND